MTDPKRHTTTYPDPFHRLVHKPLKGQKKDQFSR